MNSNSKPTLVSNSFRSKYHWRISSTSVRAFQTRATGALKVRSRTTASARLDFVVMFFYFSFLISILVVLYESAASCFVRNCPAEIDLDLNDPIAPQSDNL